MSLFKKQVPMWKVFVPFVLVLVAVAFMADTCGGQTQATVDNANKAANKWGASPNISNYYEYLQLKQIYEARDNPQLILNAYIAANDGSLRCLGKVKGFGVPYDTQWSQPQNGANGSVPEPNGLYPSGSTNADWIQLIDPATGKTSIAFAEPNLVITSQVLPCKPLNA